MRPSPRPVAGTLLGLAATLLLACGGGEGDRVTIDEDDLVTPTAPTQEEPSAPQDRSAKTLFANTCGTCHTLKEAGTTAVIGPNLDQRRPSETRVRAAIRDGVPGGAMPAGLLEGADARRVAAYVARVAGGR